MHLIGIACILLLRERELRIPFIHFYLFIFYTFFQSHNDFVAILDLPEGEHQYKFFVDGQWVHDVSEVRSFNMSLCFKTYCFPSVISNSLVLFTISFSANCYQ